MREWLQSIQTADVRLLRTDGLDHVALLTRRGARRPSGGQNPIGSPAATLAFHLQSTLGWTTQPYRDYG